MYGHGHKLPGYCKPERWELASKRRERTDSVDLRLFDDRNLVRQLRMRVRPRCRVAIVDNAHAHRFDPSLAVGRIPLAAGREHDEPRRAVADPRERLARRPPRRQPDRRRQPLDEGQRLGSRQARVREAGCCRPARPLAAVALTRVARGVNNTDRSVAETSNDRARYGVSSSS